MGYGGASACYHLSSLQILIWSFRALSSMAEAEVGMRNPA